MSPDLASGRSQVMRGAGLSDLPIATLVGASQNSLVDQDRVEQARQEGRDEGRAAAERELKSAVVSSVSVLESMANAFDTARAEWSASVPGPSLELAFELAEMILMKEVALAGDPGRDAIMRCLEELGPTEAATVHLHPADLEVIRESDDGFAGRRLRLVADPTVSSGDAVAHVEGGGMIDASLRAALHRVIEAVGSC